MSNNFQSWRVIPTATFSDQAKLNLLDFLSDIPFNPYKEFDKTVEYIKRNIKNGCLSSEVISIISIRDSDSDTSLNPVHFIRNCPIDQSVPILDFDDPVRDKHLKKKTFITEGFLLLYSLINGQPILGYTNVNDGDKFQDIYPMTSLYETQSQKTLVSIGFHKDLANHFVRPDYVNIISLRSIEKNEIFTTFVRNIDLLNCFSSEELDILKAEEFHTPFDDLSKHGDKKQKLGDAKRHAIVLENQNISFFEGRTKGVTVRAQILVYKICCKLHELKPSILMAPGDFVGINNNTSLHGKDVINIADPYEAKIRWSMKTVNASDLSKHQDYYVPDQYGLVDG